MLSKMKVNTHKWNNNTSMLEEGSQHTIEEISSEEIFSIIGPTRARFNTKINQEWLEQNARIKREEKRSKDFSSMTMLPRTFL